MIFPRYPTYKDRGVEWLGEVPGHWEVVRLKHLLQRRITDGPHTTPEFVSEGVPFLSVDGIQDGELKFDGCRYISEDDHEEYRRKALPQRDDLLMGKAASTGKIARVKVDFEFSIWSPLALIRLNPEASNPSFYEHSLKSPIVQAQIDNLCTANTQKNISMDDIPKLVLTRPPLVEQTQIAAFLDRETAKIDGLVAEQRRLMALLKEKRQAVISHAVTQGLNPHAPMKPSGVEWLGAVPAHWEVCPVRRVVSSIEQGWSPECFARPADDEEWGVLKAGCVNRGIYDPSENKALPIELAPVEAYEVHVGDVLMSRASGSPELVGSTALVTSTPGRLMLSDKIFRFQFENWIEPRFFVVALSSRPLRSQIEQALSGGNGMANNLPQSSLLGFYLSVPPKSEQLEICAYLDNQTEKLDTLTTEAQRAIDLLQERRTALVSAAVTGQIDVRGLAAVATY